MGGPFCCVFLDLTFSALTVSFQRALWKHVSVCWGYPTSPDPAGGPVPHSHLPWSAGIGAWPAHQPALQAICPPPDGGQEKAPHGSRRKGGFGFVFMRLRPPPQHRLPAWFGILISPIDVEDAVLPAVATALLGSPVGSGHTGNFIFQKPPLLITPVLFSPKNARVPPMSLVFLFTLVYFCCSVFLAHVDEN